MMKKLLSLTLSALLALTCSGCINAENENPAGAGPTAGEVAAGYSVPFFTCSI